MASCSPTRHYYYFDHHIVKVDTIKKIEAITHSLYASIEPAIAVIQNNEEPAIALQKRDTTIKDPVVEKKMKRKRVMAIAGFTSTTLGLTGIALLFWEIAIPALLITFLLLAGVIVSALGIRNDRKPLRRLARIGAWAPLFLAAALLVIGLIVLFVRPLLPVE